MWCWLRVSQKYLSWTKNFLVFQIPLNLNILTRLLNRVHFRCSCVFRKKRQKQSIVNCIFNKLVFCVQNLKTYGEFLTRSEVTNNKLHNGKCWEHQKNLFGSLARIYGVQFLKSQVYNIHFHLRYSIVCSATKTTGSGTCYYRRTVWTLVPQGFGKRSFGSDTVISAITRKFGTWSPKFCSQKACFGSLIINIFIGLSERKSCIFYLAQFCLLLLLLWTEKKRLKAFWSTFKTFLI